MAIHAQGVPLDAETIAAGVLVEAVANQHVALPLVKRRLGSNVAELLQDIIKVRRLPSRVDLYDDVASRCAAVVLLQTHIHTSTHFT